MVTSLGIISHWQGKIVEIIDLPVERDQMQMVMRSLQPRITRHLIRGTFTNLASLVLAIFSGEEGISRGLWYDSSLTDSKRKKPSREQTSRDVSSISSISQRPPRHHQLVSTRKGLSSLFLTLVQITSAFSALCSNLFATHANTIMLCCPSHKETSILIPQTQSFVDICFICFEDTMIFFTIGYAIELGFLKARECWSIDTFSSQATASNCSSTFQDGFALFISLGARS